MHYKMTTPCDQCPFLDPKVSGMKFTMKALRAHASGEFACHKACDLPEEGENAGQYTERPGDVTPHCAGVLIFLEKRNAPHQMMRIMERLGMYDVSKLNMSAPVR